MAYFFGKAYVRGYWHATQERYASSLRDHAESLIARTAPAQPAAETQADLVRITFGCYRQGLS